ncbi:MAG: 3-hydroxyacyl-CoA dehydrogenase/enoyl-CoA hydratase family protein [Methylococcales symbiont of Iophon sp. n. MRB-2018]|nr:MAG: 3-hydroxyacyl-CoA dehydrogenase/enoyl-CoA hydratase family protein [Methylococcales symbiont of Iophon sp. n. MRB-2018]KAF3980330.1 MAG: 3-hydroxyacyl-CoA dehydrogenase/enoyl-CoA hydratase family protein [Methylococcales symbiont of Iophon sp. n. MRB-2018]
MNIEKVAVIGAGVMGASIAAHVSNAGIPVYLLDIVPPGEDKNRNVIADTAVQKLLKANPAALMDKKNARLISTGNIEDHLSLLGDVDWVIEAVVENLDIKQNLYHQLEKVCKPQAVISSNTSTIPLRRLIKGFSAEFQSRFMVTHFFNPPRYMRLLELVSSAETNKGLIASVRSFATIQLGKGCVECKDSTGFIANRIGIYWIQCGLLEALKQGITVEQADAVMGAPLGIPKTGVFGLLDLVGLDLIPHIMQSMKQLPEGDAFYQINQIPELFKQMIVDGYIGRKGKGGFYRLNIAEGKRVKESIDLTWGKYSKSEKPVLDCLKVANKQGLTAFLSLDDKYSQYAWTVISKTLLYAASLMPEIADDITAVDDAMCLGYNWDKGPFQLLDKMGVDWFVDRVRQQGLEVPEILTKGSFYKHSAGTLEYRTIAGGYQSIKRDEGVLLLSDCKLQKPALLKNTSASLWDVGDAVACFEFHSKMNTFNRDILSLLRDSLKVVESDFKALVIHNEADNFSAGANLMLLTDAINDQNWEGVENLIKQGQQTFMAVKYAPFPVVAAPTGLAMGGGCEILLHCDAIQAHAELYTGLVEVGVGLIPGWGGCKEYIRRCLQIKTFGGPIPPLIKAFETIATARVSKSAAEAKANLFLAKTDGISMNKNRLLADAKTKALAMSKNYKVPEPVEYKLPGKTAKVLLDMSVKGLKMVGKVSEYDVHVATQLALVLTGGDCDMLEPLTENDMLDLECQVFTEIVKQQGTLDRLTYMLKTGKPLRN